MCGNQLSVVCVRNEKNQNCNKQTNTLILNPETAPFSIIDRIGVRMSFYVDRLVAEPLCQLN